MSKCAYVLGAGLIGSAIVSELSTRMHVLVADPKESSLNRLASVRQASLTRLNSSEIPWNTHVDVAIFSGGIPGNDPEAASAYRAISKRVLASLAGRGTEHFILISSLAVYGNVEAADEGDTLRPKTAYGFEKVVLEHELARMASRAHVSLTVLRCCGVLGSVTHPGGGWMQSAFRRAVLQRGAEERDVSLLAGHEFLFNWDVARAVGLAEQAWIPPRNGSGMLDVYNIGSGISGTPQEWRSAIRGDSTARKEPKPHTMSLLRAKEHLGFTVPAMSISSAVRALCAAQ